MAPYENSDMWRSLWQVANTIPPYIFVWYLMYLSLEMSYWLTLALAPVAAGFLVRSFIILHDCGHGAFFKSQKANNLLGHITGVLTFTPYHYWRYEHAVHHATSGDLDRRKVGDIWTLTLNEYLELPGWKRFIYRLYRNPVVLFGVAPVFLFLIEYRLPLRRPQERERRNVHRTNLAIGSVALLFSVLIGFKAYVLIQLPIIMIASSAGVWMFYVQHQFEGVYWERHDKWDYVAAALNGCSFYRLPRIMQWFTGNIGFHHVHHLGPRIPNYYLEKCYDENPIFKIKPITLRSSLRSLPLRFWDEERHELVGYGRLKTLSCE